MTTTRNLTLNLAAVSEATEAQHVPLRATKVSIDVNPSSSFSGTAWTVTLQLALIVGTDWENWVAFETSITFTNSTKTRLGLSVSGVDWIRLITTTPDGDADPAARIVLRYNDKPIVV